MKNIISIDSRESFSESEVDEFIEVCKNCNRTTEENLELICMDNPDDAEHFKLVASAARAATVNCENPLPDSEFAEWQLCPNCKKDIAECDCDRSGR
jgi:hypothetical protein